MDLAKEIDEIKHKMKYVDSDKYFELLHRIKELQGMLYANN